MILPFALAGVALIVAMVVLSRMGSRRKKQAIAELDKEREALHTPDIVELVADEVRETGIGELPGAAGIDPVVLLKVWKRDRDGCGDGDQRFVLADGVNPTDATEATVTFECER